MDAQEMTAFQPQCLFLNLPVEIKLAIYEELLDNVQEQLVPLRSQTPPGAPEVYLECHELFYRNTVFSVTSWNTENYHYSFEKNKFVQYCMASREAGEIEHWALSRQLSYVRPHVAALFERLSLIALTGIAFIAPPQIGLENLPNVKYVALQYDCMNWGHWVAALVSSLPRLRCIVMVFVKWTAREIPKAKRVMSSDLLECMRNSHWMGQVRVDHVRPMVSERIQTKGRACIGVAVPEDAALRYEFGEVRHVHFLVSKEPTARERLLRQWSNDCPEGKTFPVLDSAKGFTSLPNSALRLEDSWASSGTRGTPGFGRWTNQLLRRYPTSDTVT